MSFWNKFLSSIEEKHSDIEPGNFELFDEEMMDYIIENFPEVADNIEKALLQLSGTLEESIDYIEDTSTKIIKDTRNFNKSQEYRDACVSIYKVAENIKGYADFIKEEKNCIKNGAEKKHSIMPKTEIAIDDEKKQAKHLVKNDSDNVVSVETEVYKDLTGKIPVGFELDHKITMVDNWEDLMIRTSEILKENYRENLQKDIEIRHRKIVKKESPENNMRDIIIDMLNDYKIDLKNFKVLIS